MSFRVTRIESQKNKKNRFSIFCGEKFLIGVSDVTLLRFDLAVGSSIDENILEKIRQSEHLYALREQALRFLSRRAHSKKELRDKLLRKGYENPAALQIIQELQDKGYLNDRDFALLLIRDEINLRRSGPLLIVKKLAARGITGSVAESLLKNEYPEILQQQNALQLAQKKTKSLKGGKSNLAKQKLISFLKTKGFTWDIIEQATADIITEDDNEEL